MEPVARPRRRRHRSRPAAPWVEWAQLGLLALVVVGSALSLGAQSVAATLTFALLAWLGVGLSLSGRPSLPWVALPLGALAVWSALQAAPLPRSWLALASPHAAEIWSGAEELLGAGSLRGSLSLAPSASLLEAVKYASYAAVAIMSASLASQGRQRWVLGLLFGSALSVALVTLLHGVLGAKLLYGVLPLSFDPGPWGMGPLVNPNNRGGYFNLGLFAGLGLAVQRDARAGRSLLALGVALLVAMSLLAHSRGATLALGAGVLWLGGGALWRRLRRRQASSSDGAALLLLGCLVAGGAFVLLGSGGAGVGRVLDDGSLRKLEVQGWSKPLLVDYAWLGVGRGAFEGVFAAYRRGGGYISYQYAENFIIQWVAEWGAPVALAALATLTYALWARRGERAPTRLVRVGLGVLLLQNLVDLALELPAVALAVAAASGVLSAPWRRLAAPPPPGRWRLALAALGGGTLLLGGLWGRTSQRDARDALGELRRAALQAGSGEARGAAFEAARRLVASFPADAYGALVGAEQSRWLAPREQGRWVGWALERDPASGRAQIVLADYVHLRGGPSQALGALRRAVELEPALGRVVAGRIARWATSPAQVLQAVPEGRPGAALLLLLAKRPELEAQQLELLDEAVRRDEDSQPARVQYVGAALKALDAGAPACAGERRQGCLERAEQVARALAERYADSASGVELVARVLARAERVDAALAWLDERCPRLSQGSGCWRLRLELSWERPLDDQRRAALRAYVTLACDGAESCAKACSWVGRQLAAHGSHAAAVDYFGRAVREHPSATGWLDLAKAAQAAGQQERAREALRRAKSLGAREDGVRRQVEAVEQQLR